MSGAGFGEAAPVEQRDAPSLQEALEVCPYDGPRPLTIAEYRARKKNDERKPKKSSGQRIKLLQQRRLIKDFVKAATNDQEKEKHRKNFEVIEDQLCKRALGFILKTYN
ncbi:hypothetical protein KR067_003411 [Drosophila pandora]|nr:hypothetical protein KR067_003411 [Drosophila pandora]